MAPKFPRVFKLSLALALVWTCILAASLLWNVLQSRQQLMGQAYAEARANLNKDITFRRWATRHGGIYVPLTEDQPPIPWLGHLPNRDVVTRDGQTLTLLNPASMLRQMMDQYAVDYGIKGRITGLKALNPANLPDAWEKAQLEAFTRGERRETSEVVEDDGQPQLRYLRAMYMEPGCEKCHAVLGYRQGDVRGGIGVNLPLDGYYAQMRSNNLNLGLSHGAIWLLGLAGIVGVGRFSQRRNEEKDRADAALRLYANMFKHSGEAILVTDPGNKVVDANPALLQMTGYSLEELRGRDPSMLASGRTPQATYWELWRSLTEQGYWQGELWDRRKDGSIYPKWASLSLIRDEQGQITHHIASFTDISERKQAEARIERLAHHDFLTGLLNRYSLESRLEQALLSAKREQYQLAVIFIDLDRFKVINDSLGHPFGDRLLIEVARRLESAVRESDIVARQGGDEFVVVLTRLASEEDVLGRVNQIQERLNQAYQLGEHVLHSSPSVGVAIFPGDGDTPATLMKNADTAMYHAKSKGRNNAQFFTAKLNEMASERLEMERDLRLAIDEGQFVLHYQPQVEALSGRICGVEALIRWQHPQLGMIPPVKFIPVAEESRLILAIGRWVLEEACRQLAAWQALGITGLRMAVNLSAHQLHASELVVQVGDCLQRYGLAGENLELEITESVAMENPEQAIRQLQTLCDLGVHLAIDDFGTGYSSLAYLKNLPIHTLKLDRSFVRDIETDSNDAAISAATLALAHNLGLKVVAEGVETEAQQEFLVRHACDYLQGYLFGKPQAPADLEPRLRAG